MIDDQDLDKFIIELEAKYPRQDDIKISHDDFAFGVQCCRDDILGFVSESLQNLTSRPPFRMNTQVGETLYPILMDYGVANRGTNLEDIDNRVHLIDESTDNDIYFSHAEFDRFISLCLKMQKYIKTIIEKKND